jgi:hypothetical protein
MDQERSSTNPPSIVMQARAPPSEHEEGSETKEIPSRTKAIERLLQWKASVASAYTWDIETHSGGEDHSGLPLPEEYPRLIVKSESGTYMQVGGMWLKWEES